ncbi:hypothetical protein D3C87_1665440 [compost metagenome]
MDTVAVNPVMQDCISIIADGCLVLIKSCRNRTEIDYPHNRTQHKQRERPRIVYTGSVHSFK